MDLLEKVYDLCRSEGDKSEESTECLKLLIEARADVHAGDGAGRQAI
jgi:hypothetical protein